ncbi:MAG: cation:proton antiporter [Phycisphaerales bacterium]
MKEMATQSLSLAVGVGALVSVACDRFKFPAVLPLLVTGVCLGGAGLGVVDGNSLGESLRAFISVAIGLLVFEGGLHLDKHELGKAPRAVWGLLTIGALLTWIGVALAAHYVVGLEWANSLVLGAILIVTGPTVIQPILRRLPLKPNLHAALSAEGVLIDPIGVIVAISTLELVLLYQHGTFENPFSGVFKLLAVPFLGGAVIGVVVGVLGRSVLRFLVRRGRLDPTHLNLFALGTCMLAVGLGESAAPEAGLVATTVAAVILANANISGTRDLRTFKQQIATILVGALFILLASRLEWSRITSISWVDAAFVGVLFLLVRPVSVFVSTIRSRLSVNERLFAGLFAPRGIVAASMASVAAVRLSLPEEELATASESAIAISRHAQQIETLVFLVIFVTVAFAGSAGGLVASILRVRAGVRNAVVIVGAHKLGQQLATQLVRRKVPVLLIDTNSDRVNAAARAGIPTVEGDATDPRWMDEAVFRPDQGWLVAWTGNVDVDRVVRRWGIERLGEGHAGAWPEQKPGEGSGSLMTCRGAISSVEFDMQHVRAMEGGEATTPVLAWVDEKQRFGLGPGLGGTPVPKGGTAMVLDVMKADGVEGNGGAASSESKPDPDPVVEGDGSASA